MILLTPSFARFILLASTAGAYLKLAKLAFMGMEGLSTHTTFADFNRKPAFCMDAASILPRCPSGCAVEQATSMAVTKTVQVVRTTDCVREILRSMDSPLLSDDIAVLLVASRAGRPACAAGYDMIGQQNACIAFHG